MGQQIGAITMAGSKKLTYTTVFESSRALGRLLAPDDLTWETELPLRARHVPLILHLSCNAHYTAFIPYIAQQILKQLGLEFIILGGPENCCGALHTHLGDGDLEEEIATKALLGFRRSSPKTVVSICPDCDEVFEKHRLKGSPFRHSNISDLFIEHLETLKTRMQPVNRRVVVHFHDINPSRQADADRMLTILNAIPGLEILAAKHTHGPGIHCQTLHPMSPEDQASMFAEAKELGADAVVVPYHSCYRQHVKMQLSSGVETHHYLNLLAMSLGIAFEEPFKELRLLDDVDAVMTALRPKIDAMGYPVDVIRSYVERAIFC
jgi:hypothetical protein